MVEEVRYTGVPVLQIVDHAPAGAYARLRQAAPWVRIVQVVHVAGPETVDEVLRVAGAADAILLDSGSREGPVARLGGTGQVHDWAVSRKVVEAVDRPVILAGGLRPENVGEAIRRVRPYAVDLCTGLRTNERLDPVKLRAFMAEVRAADW
jgi:phosphoribosylanthranilate isomerase